MTSPEDPFALPCRPPSLRETRLEVNGAAVALLVPYVALDEDEKSEGEEEVITAGATCLRIDIKCSSDNSVNCFGR